MTTALYNQSVSADHALPVGQTAEGTPFTVKVVAGGTVYYADNWQVSASSNQGQLTAGQSAFFTIPQWLRSASQSDVLLTISDPLIPVTEAPTPPAVDLCAEFGVSTVLTDNSGPINAALATLGPLGLDAYISKPGAYNIQNPLVNGNGSGTTRSTWGCKLLGAGYPSIGGVGWGGPPNTTISWTGAAGAEAMMLVNGAVNGWGLERIKFNGNGGAACPKFALRYSSGQWGEVTHVLFQGCLSGVHAMVNAGGTSALFNSFTNTFRHIGIQWVATQTGPLPNGWYGGVWWDGLSANADTSYDHYENVFFGAPVSAGGQTHTHLYFGACDNVTVQNAHMSFPGGQLGTLLHVAYDYTVNAANAWPTDCRIDGVDFATGASGTFVNVGTPSATAQLNNRILNISATNGRPPNPNLAGLNWNSTNPNGTVALAAGTSGSIADARITANSIVRPANIKAGGTVGALSVTLSAGVGFTINSTSNTDTSTVLWEIVGY